MGAVGIEGPEDRIDALLKELEGKDIADVVAGGLSKLASVPSGGGVAAGPASGGGGGGGAAGDSSPHPLSLIWFCSFSAKSHMGQTSASQAYQISDSTNVKKHRLEYKYQFAMAPNLAIWKERKEGKAHVWQSQLSASADQKRESVPSYFRASRK